MYVSNGKISARQTFRLYVFDFMGIATLLLPPHLAKLCGSDGIWVILLGSGLGLLFLWYLGRVMKRMGCDMTTYLKEHTPSYVQKLCFALVGIHSVFTAGFCAWVFTTLMRRSLIREAGFTLVLTVILVTAGYAVSGGIEGRARIYEILFWFVLVPYVVMMLASVRHFEPVYLDGFLQSTPQELGKGIWLVFLFLTPLFYSLFLVGAREERKNKKYGSSMTRVVAGALLLASVILLGSYVLLLGNFGEKALATMEFPVITLMSTVQFEGNFLKRMDAFMVAVWFFTLFALLNLHLHYGAQMMQNCSKKLENHRSWTIALPTAIALPVALWMNASEEAVGLFLKYYSYVAVPMMILGTGILVLPHGSNRTVAREKKTGGD